MQSATNLSPILAPYPIDYPTEFVELIKDFHKAFCDERLVPYEKMMKWIQHGEDIILNLSGRLELLEIQKQVCTDEEACALMWFLTAQAVLVKEAAYDTMRIVPGNELYKLLVSHPHCYTRVSTHYNELSNRWAHKGIDLGDIEGIGLPADKRTILFGVQLNNPATFIKLEEHGCPPFWKKEFRTLKNFIEFICHAIDYLNSRPLLLKMKDLAQVIKKLKRRGTTPPSPLTSRHCFKRSCTEEEIDAEIMKVFQECVQSITTISPKDKKEFIREAKKHGVHYITTFFNEIKRQSHDGVKSEKEKVSGLQKLKALIKKDKQRKVHHLYRKGNEVILPLTPIRSTPVNKTRAVIKSKLVLEA